MQTKIENKNKLLLQDDLSLDPETFSLRKKNLNYVTLIQNKVHKKIGIPILELKYDDICYSYDII